MGTLGFVRKAAATVALATLVALAPVPASAHIARGRYAIGDSVMLGAKPQLRARGFVVNATESRQFSGAVTIVRRKAASGVLRRKVVIHLGTNGILIRASQCDAIARAAGKRRHVFLVTVTGPTSMPRIRKAQNTRLHACAARHRNTSVIDWYRRSRGHGAWFYDGMHLTPKGRVAYATFLDRKTS
jgi:hypothetical protein